MSGLAAATVLEMWERCRGQTPTRSALELLQAAGRGPDEREITALPLGERDRRLLALREELLGETLECRVACPRCREVLELTIAVSDLLDLPAGARESPELRIGELWLRTRLPTSADLLALEDCGDLEEAVCRLVRRLIPEVRRGGRPIDAGQLRPDELDRVGAALAAADPGAGIELRLSCVGCQHSWHELLDVATFVPAEIEHLARRLLRQVHVLARAYGWREQDILALSPARREAYLELLAP